MTTLYSGKIVRVSPGDRYATMVKDEDPARCCKTVSGRWLPCRPFRAIIPVSINPSRSYLLLDPEACSEVYQAVSFAWLATNGMLPRVGAWVTLSLPLMEICGVAYPLLADGILIWNWKVGLHYFIQHSGTHCQVHVHRLIFKTFRLFVYTFHGG